jgi:hypothetical protein
MPISAAHFAVAQTVPFHWALARYHWDKIYRWKVYSLRKKKGKKAMDWVGTEGCCGGVRSPKPVVVKRG